MILIRADGNTLLGTGHIMRCLAVAGELKRAGQECTFVTADNEPNSLIDNQGFLHIALNTDYRNPLDEINQFKIVIEEYKPAVIFIDSYYVNRLYFETLRNICGDKVKLIYLDDLRDDVYPCDALIHYGVEGELLKDDYIKRYRGLIVPIPVFLLGADYAPLREEFDNKKHREIRNEVGDILILTGGADVSHTSVQILDYLRTSRDYKNMVFHFVIGKMNSDLKKIQEISEGIRNVRIHIGVEHMSDLMNKADIAISAGGTTIYELCACGTPMIIFTCADNQIEGAKKIANKIRCPLVGDARNNKDLIKEIFLNINTLCENTYVRHIISEKEQDLVDGKGTSRIKNIILELIRENKTK